MDSEFRWSEFVGLRCGEYLVDQLTIHEQVSRALVGGLGQMGRVVVRVVGLGFGCG